MAIASTDQSFQVVCTMVRLTGTGSLSAFGSANRPFLSAELMGAVGNMASDI